MDEKNMKIFDGGFRRTKAMAMALLAAAILGANFGGETFAKGNDKGKAATARPEVRDLRGSVIQMTDEKAGRDYLYRLPVKEGSVEVRLSVAGRGDARATAGVEFIDEATGQVIGARDTTALSGEAGVGYFRFTNAAARDVLVKVRLDGDVAGYSVKCEGAVGLPPAWMGPPSAGAKRNAR